MIQYCVCVCLDSVCTVSELSMQVDRPWSIYRCASVSCGHAHALVLSVIGVVFSCGHGSQGQLGHGGLESESSLRMVEALEGLTMTCVAAGGWHSAATSDSGDVYVWGWNDQGQLGLQSHLQVASYWLHTVCLSVCLSVTARCDVYMWG